MTFVDLQARRSPNFSHCKYSFAAIAGAAVAAIFSFLSETGPVIRNLLGRNGLSLPTLMLLLLLLLLAGHSVVASPLS